MQAFQTCCVNFPLRTVVFITTIRLLCCVNLLSFTHTVEHWPTGGFLIVFSGLLLIGALLYYVYRLQQKERERRLLFLHADQIDNPEDIQRMLDTLIREKVRLRIRLNERRKSYTSSLLSFDSSSLLIDELFPIEGNELIVESQFISVDFMLTTVGRQRVHMSYGFESTYLASQQWKGFPALRISFPTKIIRNQKRKYLRISPPVNEPLYIRYTLDGQEHNEKIVNISASGASFYTALGRSTLAPGIRLDQISIELPGHCMIQCSAIVRNFRLNEQPVVIDGRQVPNYCGIEFVQLSESVREKIVKYVISRERQELKHLSREFA